MIWNLTSSIIFLITMDVLIRDNCAVLKHTSPGNEEIDEACRVSIKPLKLLLSFLVIVQTLKVTGGHLTSICVVISDVARVS